MVAAGNTIVNEQNITTADPTGSKGLGASGSYTMLKSNLLKLREQA